jgi:hypothetical protein
MEITTMPIDIDGLSYEEFNLGARVSFDSEDGRQLGTLVKYNRKTVNVLGDDGRQWRISPSLLSPVKDVDRQTQPRHARNKKRIR